MQINEVENKDETREKMLVNPKNMNNIKKPINRKRSTCGIDDADPSDKPLEESKEGDLWEDRDKAGHESAPIRGGEELVQGLFQTGFLSLSQGGGKKGSFKEMEASLIAPEE